MKVHSDTSFPTITPYGAENSSYGNSVTSAKANPLPDSLQELIELSAIQQNPAAHVEKLFEKSKVLKGTSVASSSSAAAPSALQVDPDYFARPTEFHSASTNQSSQTAVQFPPDAFAPPVQVADPTFDSSESLGIVPVDGAAGERGTPGDKLQPHPWSSAKQTQEWLETVKNHRSPAAQWMAHQWQTRRANIYIGVAALILSCDLGWGSNPLPRQWRATRLRQPQDST